MDETTGGPTGNFKSVEERPVWRVKVSRSKDTELPAKLCQLLLHLRCSWLDGIASVELLRSGS